MLFFHFSSSFSFILLVAKAEKYYGKGLLNMFKKLKQFMADKAKKAEQALAPALAAGAAVGVIPTVYADTGNAADEAITAIIDIVFQIFKYIGIVLALWGAGSLILAFKNEDADSKTRAIMSLIVGISLVALDALFGDMVEDLIAA